jgi:hypothetical protein
MVSSSIVFRLRRPNNTIVPAAVLYDSASRTVTLTPDSNLTAGTIYTAELSNAEDVGGNELAPDSWTFTTVSLNCPCSLWGSSATPTIPAASDGTPIEVGIKFRADIDGFVTGIRFYKGAANTGTHVAHLWSSSGSLLATATFTNETASGWQEVTLAAPVAINAGSTYIASYHSSNGYYAATGNYFISEHVNWPLRAPASASVGGNGVFKYGASGFPASGSNSNYWVDVLFEPSP